MKHCSCFPTEVKESKQQSHRLFLNLRGYGPRLKMYKIALGSELKASCATKTKLTSKDHF